MTHPPRAKKKAPGPQAKASPAVREALEALDSFVLLTDLFTDRAGRAFHRLLKFLSKEGELDASKGLKRYGRWWRAVMEVQAFTRHPRVGNSLQDYWLERFLDDPNPFHRKSELSAEPAGPALEKAYRVELERFQSILGTDWEGEFRRRVPLPGKAEVPSWEGKGLPGPGKVPPALQARKEIKGKILSGPEGRRLAAEIGRHFSRNGWGLFGRHRAFRWQAGREGRGTLTGVEEADPIRLDNLVGYDEQRRPLLENIEAFVAGKGANNVLIYGERGTGKSSTVKALLNAYQEKGLRLVEVHPALLNDYQEILPHLRGRREKFILFVDDLSFEENETSYKGLKALLEGTVEAAAANVILVATSNRRHLIREFFDDRSGGVQADGEIHGADTVEEKLSLADRFGLVVSFYTPGQETYLRMVENWAREEGIDLPAPELHRRALQWEKSNNVRSGRTARQFINDLKGKI